MKSLKKLFLLLIVVGIVSAVVFYFRDTKPPQFTLTPESGSISKKSRVMLNISDDGMGLKQLEVSVLQGNNKLPLLKRDFPPQTGSTEFELDLSSLRLKQGDLQIEITATDHSIYHLGKGNSSQNLYALNYDTRPPVISILSKAHNFTKGGSGLVTFSVNEDAEGVGIQFGDYFFPAYLQDSGIYACMFAYPYDSNDKTFVPRVFARDLAGNERQAGIYYRANNKKFRQRKIKITDAFLNQKAPELEALVPEIKSPLEMFLYVNQEVRQQNRQTMAELGLKTSHTPLWNGAFQRQPKAATLALFPDYRTYYYKGKVIDKTVHWGHDLASTAQAEIIAENDGEVIWSEYMGIYGQCVVVDHGLGLQSLYAHMSHLEVETGETVVKGQVIGRSGATGLAGGDHLHLGMFVSGIPVQPVEWWDKNWLKNNIDSKLTAQ